MRFFFWIASICTIFGVSVRNALEFWQLSSFGGKLALLLAAAASLVIAVLDLQSWWRNRAKRYKSEQSINEYLLRLLERGGSVSVFANHLSWVRSSPSIRNLLIQQARAGRDVRIYVPHNTDLTRELSAKGVRVISYESLEYEPEARFTLLNPNEPGSSLLAIGKGTLPDFFIEEFSDATHSRVISVARDLLQIVERIGEKAQA